MASNSETYDGIDAVSSDPLTEETTATKRHRLNSSTGAPISPPPSSSDTTPLPSLPFEIVVEILSRLPVMFLMQLQSVCKSWKSLISDPQFAKKHLRVSTTRHHLLLTFPSPSSEIFHKAYPISSVFSEVTATATHIEYPLNNPINPNCFALVDSCHGIQCFSLDQRFVILWNPSIRKFTKLPDNPKRERNYTIYGFGYTHFSDNYKVVAVANYRESDGCCKTQVKVFTLGTTAWRRIQDFPSGVHFYDSGKFLSGTVNWLTSRNNYSPRVIVSLDLEKESYQEFSQPDYGGVTVDTLSLWVLRDCLCILSFSDSDTFSYVWLMQEYGNKDSWTKLLRVPNMRGLSSYPYIKALYVSKDDKILLRYQSILVVYNARDGTFKTLDFHDVNELMIPEIYQESLISPWS